jgi:hypothetical protein
MCCHWGVQLSDAEALAIAALHGRTKVIGEPGSYRTAVTQDGCVFLAANACTLHDRLEYPATCRGYPWTDGLLGGPYLYEVECPEFPQ